MLFVARGGVLVGLDWTSLGWYGWIGVVWGGIHVDLNRDRDRDMQCNAAVGNADGDGHIDLDIRAPPNMVAVS